MRSTNQQPSQSRSCCIVAYAFGALFVALSIAVFVMSNHSLGAVIEGIVIGGIGLAMISSYRSKTSWLARIGPLP